MRVISGACWAVFGAWKRRVGGLTGASSGPARDRTWRPLAGGLARRAFGCNAAGLGTRGELMQAVPAVSGRGDRPAWEMRLLGSWAP